MLPLHCSAAVTAAQPLEFHWRAYLVVAIPAARGPTLSERLALVRLSHRFVAHFLLAEEKLASANAATSPGSEAAAAALCAAAAVGLLAGRLSTLEMEREVEAPARALGVISGRFCAVLDRAIGPKFGRASSPPAPSLPPSLPSSSSVAPPSPVAAQGSQYCSCVARTRSSRNWWTACLSRSMRQLPRVRGKPGRRYRRTRSAGV